MIANDKELVKNSLFKHLTNEEASLLSKSSKDLSKADLSLLIPLSKYNLWLDRAGEVAVEIQALDRGLLKENISKTTKADIDHCISMHLACLRIYRQKAAKHHAEYKRLHRALCEVLSYSPKNVLPCSTKLSA